MPLCAPVEIIIPFGNSKDLPASASFHPEADHDELSIDQDDVDNNVRAMFEKMLLDCDKDDDDYSTGSDTAFSDDSSFDSKSSQELFDDDSISLKKRSISSAIDSMMNANDKAECGKLRPRRRNVRPVRPAPVSPREEEEFSSDDDESEFEDFVVPVKDC